ncbi:hypothetical protein ACFQ3Z_27575 [Streptomyces nogalater]
MSSFTRPPEWQQPADRHTRLSDPVLTVRQLSRFEFSLKHVVRIDHALVFTTPKGGYDAYLPPHRPTRSEIVAHRYTAVYEVDMGVHPFTGTFTLPSDNDAFEFTAEVDFSWQVLDPAGFVRSGHRDVPGLLVGMLQQTARPVSRRFPVADSATAERELLTALAPLGTLGSDVGLQVTWTLRLRRDQAGIEHQQRLQAIDHSAAEQIRVAQRGRRSTPSWTAGPGNRTGCTSSGPWRTDVNTRNSRSSNSTGSRNRRCCTARSSISSLYSRPSTPWRCSSTRPRRWPSTSGTSSRAGYRPGRCISPSTPATPGWS